MASFVSFVIPYAPYCSPSPLPHGTAHFRTSAVFSNSIDEVTFAPLSQSATPFPTAVCTSVVCALARLARDPVLDIALTARELLAWVDHKAQSATGAPPVSVLTSFIAPFIAPSIASLIDCFVD